MGSLIIIPAAAAKYLTRSLNGIFAIAVVIAVTPTVAGEVVAARVHRSTGSVIIAFAVVLFFASLALRRRARKA